MLLFFNYNINFSPTPKNKNLFFKRQLSMFNTKERFFFSVRDLTLQKKEKFIPFNF